MKRSKAICYTYRYFWKLKDGNLCVKYVTDVVEAHEKFMENIRNSSDVVSSYREYVNQIDVAYVGYTESVKEEKKEVKESEENVG